MEKFIKEVASLVKKRKIDVLMLETIGSLRYHDGDGGKNIA